MIFSSLKSRILILTTIPLIVVLVVFLAAALSTANRAVRRSVDRSLTDAGSVFVKLLETRRSELQTMALVTSRDPRFFAMFAIPEADRSAEFAPTVRGVAEDFLRITDVDFLEVYDERAERIALVSRDVEEQTRPVTNAPSSVRQALQGLPVTNVDRMQEHLVVTAVVPVFVANHIRAVLRVGNHFDQEFIEEVERLTGAHVALMDASSLIATTFPVDPQSPSEDWPRATFRSHPTELGSYRSSEAFPTRRAGIDYLAMEVRLASLTPQRVFHAYLGRELSVELQPMVRLTWILTAAGIAALAIILLMAWIVAHRITSPLETVVHAAKAMQRGDYDQPLPERGADEVAFLARSFGEMRRDLAANMTRLKNLDQMKSNFISLAGHELKTPLTVITSFNEMIMSGDMGRIPDSMQEATRTIQTRLTDLNRLVTNILEVTQFEQGLSVLQPRRVELRRLLTDLVESRHEALEGRALQLRTHFGDGDLSVQADPDYLCRAFEQLVDNAIRFTPDDGRVDVHAERVGSTLRIAVRDTGIGIPEEQQPWIFEKAWESNDLMHHRSGHFEFGTRGLGLGLPLARSIVRAHGGEIELDSRPGAGSCFTVVLQCGVEMSEARPAEMATA